MCEDCGCTIAGALVTQKASNRNLIADEASLQFSNIHANPQLNESKTVDVIKNILHKNDHEAAHNRQHFEQHQVLALNLMSSPGSGKTSLLEALAELDGQPFQFGVIEGDLETSRDADRIKAKGIPAFQIQTGSACHLDAFMVHKGLHAMPLAELDVCFIENVGNLVCPASYDVGSHLNIVLLSVPEGDDKVEKYPVMFHKADLVLITKTDLLPHFDFNVDAAKAMARQLNPKVDVMSFSVKNPDDVQQLANWISLKQQMRL